MAVTGKQKFSGSDLSALMNRALDEDGAVIIKRPGRKDLVVLRAERLREMDTAAYLMASPANRRRLTAALRDARAGKGRATSLRQLRQRIGLGA